MKNPSVSVIIVNFNGKNLLKTILHSVEQSLFRDFEVIVVDNNSSDESLNSIRKNFGSTVVVQNKENLGYCGINSALKFCRGRYILFLNNDMQLDKNCIKNLVAALDKDKDAVMAAPVLVNFYDKRQKSGGTWVSRAFYSGHIRGDGKSKNIIEIPYMGVGLIRKDFVSMFGYLFDPDYFIYAEDLDLGLRIRLCSKKALLVHDAIAYHMHAITIQKAGNSFTTYLLERNSITTFLKIMSVKNIILLSPYIILIRIFVILRDVFSLRFNAAFSRIRAIAFVLVNILVIMNKRKNVQKFRKADDSYILEVFSEKYLLKGKFLV